MSEMLLRWQGRIGRAKPLAPLFLIFGVVALLFGLVNLRAFLDNPGEPAPVEISQLLQGEIAADRYVVVSGWTNYEVFYSETEK